MEPFCISHKISYVITLDAHVRFLRLYDYLRLRYIFQEISFEIDQGIRKKSRMINKKIIHGRDVDEYQSSRRDKALRNLCLFV